MRNRLSPAKAQRRKGCFRLTLRLCSFAGDKDESTYSSRHINKTIEHRSSATRDKALMIFIEQRVNDYQDRRNQEPAW